MIALGLASKGLSPNSMVGWSVLDETGVMVGGGFLGDRATSARPALAWFKGRLYMAWRGPRVDQEFFWATLDLEMGQPQPWSLQHGPLDNKGSADGPALMAFHDTLYMVWRGVDDDRALYWATFNETAQSWNPQQPVGDNFASSFGPALAVFHDSMYMAWNGAKDDQNLYWTTFNEAAQRWNPRNDLTDRGSKEGPALVIYSDKLFMFWRGIYEETDIPGLPPIINDDARVYFATFDGIGDNPQWSSQQLVNPEIRSLDMPSVAVFRGEIYIAHSPVVITGGTDDPLGLDIFISKFDGSTSVQTDLPNLGSGAPASLVAFPEIPGVSIIQSRSVEGAVSLYVIGPDGKVYSNFWPAAQGSLDWSGWFSIGDNTFSQGSPISGIHPRSDEGAVSLYVIGPDGKVYSNFWPASQGSLDWSGWFSIGDNTFSQGSPISGIHPRSDEGAVSLYVIGPDGKVYSNFWPAAQGSLDWSGWFAIGDKTFPQGSPVSVIHPRSDEGAVSLYVIGTDGKVYSNFWPAAQGSLDWSGWFAIGDNTFPQGSPVSVIHPRSEEGAVSLYVIGPDGKVYSSFWPAAQGSLDWSGWFAVGDNTFPQGSPVSVIHPRSDEGAVSLYVIGTDGKVYSSFWPAAPGSLDWSGWFDINGKSFPAGYPVSVIHPRSDEGAVSLYVIGLDGKVYSNFWPAAQGSLDWSGWFALNEMPSP